MLLLQSEDLDEYMLELAVIEEMDEMVELEELDCDELPEYIVQTETLEVFEIIDDEVEAEVVDDIIVEYLEQAEQMHLEITDEQVETEEVILEEGGILELEDDEVVDDEIQEMDETEVILRVLV